MNAQAPERGALSLLVSETKGASKVSGADSEQTREGHLEVLADHSTDGQGFDWEGGEVMLKRPTVGKGNGGRGDVPPVPPLSNRIQPTS